MSGKVVLWISYNILAVTIATCSLYTYGSDKSILYAAPAAGDSSTKPAAQPQDKSTLLNEAGVKAIEQKNLLKAESLFKQALIQDPGNLTAVFNLSGTYLTQKKSDLAISLLTDYIKRYDNDAGLHARLGDAYFSSKNIELAQRSYEKALSLAPNYYGVPAKLASIYGLQKNFKGAETMLEKAVAQNDKDPALLNSLSNIYIMNSKSAQAIEVAKRALQIKASKELYATLGTAYETQRDYKNSLIAFEKAINLGDTRPEVIEKVAAMKKQLSIS